MKRIALIIVGWVFLLLGIIGLVLPVIQGVLCIMIGLAILSTRSEFIKRQLERLEKRYPEHYRKVTEARGKISNWFKKKPDGTSAPKEPGD